MSRFGKWPTMAGKAEVALAALLVASVQGETLQHECSGDYGPNVWCNTNEFIPYDGYFHNFAEPTWGGIDQPYARKLVTAYEDVAGFKPSGHLRPNARTVSRGLMSGPSGHGSYRKRSALMTFFGQQVVEEVLDTQVSGCTPEYFNIPIPAGDDLFDPMGNGDVFIPLLRSRYAAATGNAPNNPRQQINLITPFFDGNLLYGENKFVADGLRSFHHGFLQTNDTQDLSYACGAQIEGCPTLGRTALGYKGVYPTTGSNSFQAHIDRHRHLGSAPTAEGAALLYARHLGPEASAAAAAVSSEQAMKRERAAAEAEKAKEAKKAKQQEAEKAKQQRQQQLKQQQQQKQQNRELARQQMLQYQRELDARKQQAASEQVPGGKGFGCAGD